MSYNDKKKGFTLPTRHGSPLGGASERQMLDQVGGSPGYRKNFRIEPDGTTTMLTTKNGQPQFQTLVDGSGSDESKNKAGLASGAVFLKPNGETYYIRTSAVAAYAAPEAKVKLVDRIDKTLIGTQPKDKSKATAAVAFAPPMVMRCPSSLFTGKMRLYVQCLYGSIDALPADLALVDDGTILPSLIYAGVPLDTSCGIYLNETTGKHYLISVTSGNAHELIRTPGVRWLEKKLIDPAIPSSEKTKIEAYLLAQSYPSAPQGMDLPPRIAGGAFGYGWHFDWQGKNTDCVGIETAVNPGDGQPCYKSTHYRIHFSFVGGYISGSLSVISQGLWRNNRKLQPLCSLDWSTMSYVALGFLFLPEFGSGPLYAHYGHTTDYPGSSTIQVSSFSASEPYTVPRSGESGGVNPGSVSCAPGQGYRITTTAAHSASRITVDAGVLTVSVENSNFASSGYGSTPATPVEPNIATDSAFGTGGVPLSALGTPPHMVNSGNEIPGSPTTTGWAWSDPLISYTPGSGTFPQIAIGGGALEAMSVYTSVNRTLAYWDSYSSGIGTVTSGYIIWFPVFWDAEAVYLWGRSSRAESETKTFTPMVGDWGYKWIGLGGDVGPATLLVTQWLGYWNPNAGASDGPSYDISTVTRTDGPITEGLLCGSDTHAPTLPFAHFIDGVHDSIAEGYDVRRSVGGALYSYFFNLDIGNAPLNFSGGWASYTGWA